ncbi:sugar phosphate isomerase/epimerase [bacterium]|nr:sugar phosphate isomerase/epimerase [bacterium]
MKSCINEATTMPYSLEEDITSVSKVGFEGIELWVDKVKKYLESHSTCELKVLLERDNLKPASICPFFFNSFGDIDASIKSIEWGAKIAREIGCDLLVICPDIPPKDMSYKEAVKIAGNNARKCAEVTSSYGVKLAIEPLGMHPFIPGPKEALDIVESANHDFLGIIMDTFHYYKSGVSLEEIEAIPVEKLLLVHINDCEDLPREVLTDKNRLFLGLGVIPLKEILKILKKKGYTGFLSVEIFRDEYWTKPIDDITRSAFESLQSLLKNLGEV